MNPPLGSLLNPDRVGPDRMAGFAIGAQSLLRSRIVEVSGNRFHHLEEIPVIAMLHDLCALAAHPVGFTVEGGSIHQLFAAP